MFLYYSPPLSSPIVWELYTDRGGDRGVVYGLTMPPWGLARGVLDSLDRGEELKSCEIKSLIHLIVEYHALIVRFIFKL